MKLKSVDWLRCIVCSAPLARGILFTCSRYWNDRRGTAWSVRPVRRAFPIVRSIARFVPSEDYAHSFGYQWNYFDKTQLDSHMGNDLSRRTIFRHHAMAKANGRTGGSAKPACGMGRFTQIALETGAELFSFDLSNAVEANLRNKRRTLSESQIRARPAFTRFHCGKNRSTKCFAWEFFSTVPMCAPPL